MKTALSSIAGLMVVCTFLSAQRPDREMDSKADTIEYIKRETIGGKLDFNSVLREPGFLAIEHKGVRFNRKDYPVFLWGQTVSDLGLESSAQASSLWEEIHKLKLTGPQRTALKIGFEKKLE